MAYNYTAQWLKGSKNDAPDALSRHPLHDPEVTDALAELDTNDDPEMSLTEIRAVGDQHHESLRLQEIHKHAAQDEQYQLLQNFILKGFPKHCRQLPESCRIYWNVHQHLTLDDGPIVYGCRLLIPSTMRKKVLDNLHEAHQGVLRTKQRA